jgi:hypothetical protein
LVPSSAISSVKKSPPRSAAPWTSSVPERLRESMRNPPSLPLVDPRDGGDEPASHVGTWCGTEVQTQPTVQSRSVIPFQGVQVVTDGVTAVIFGYRLNREPRGLNRNKNRLVLEPVCR